MDRFHVDLSDCQIESVKVEDVVVLSDRQRKDLGDLVPLAHSIKRNGLLQPIIINKDNELISGERRLAAHKLIQYHYINCVRLEELSKDLQELIELEENVKRKQLTWQEECLAVLRIAELSDETSGGMAAILGVTERTVFRYMRVARELKAGRGDIESCQTVGAAYNILDRETDRQVEAEMDEVDVALDDVADVQLEVDPETGQLTRTETSPAVPSVRPASKDVLQGDFLKWVPDYEGPKYNFIHCDFPYGVGHHKSEQGGSDRHGAYEDTAETYFTLLSAFLEHDFRFIASNAHIMFWFSMNFYRQTVEAFEDNGYTVDPFPLIWFKSDNTGILPDPQRGPRRVYETALQITRGDRKIVRSVSNVIAHPAKKKEAKHLSEKPGPVLAHFFRMFVDTSTALFDPTCGSGGALVEAERLKALRVLGMDQEEKYVETSRMGLNKFRRQVMDESLDEDLEVDLDDLE